MKHRIALMAPAALLLILVALLPWAWTSLAQGSYDLTWRTADGGGGISSGGRYTVYDTIGQPDAGDLHGGAYVLSGGFWGGIRPAGGPGPHVIYLPLVLQPQ